MTSRLTGSWGSRIRCRAGAATWRSATTRSSTPCRGCAAREPRGGTRRSATASGSPSAGGSTAGPGTARWSACSRHCGRNGSSGWKSARSIMDRACEGDSARPPAAPPKGNRAAPWDRDREACKGRKHGRTRLQPHEALPQGRHPPRQARRGLSRRPRLILIIIYLKKRGQKPN